jgi:hypothetical protein
MTNPIRNYFSKSRQRRLQQAYEIEEPPIFSLTPEFFPLTYDQRELLFQLVRTSKSEIFRGEFQWCIETVPTGNPPMHYIMGIKPVSYKAGTFDPNNPMFQNKDWKRVTRNGQMKTLEDGGYISISPFIEHIIDEENIKEEKWVHFCLNQKAYDCHRFMNSSSLRRFFHILWEGSYKHFVTIIISLISGLVGAILIKLLIG